MKIKTSTRTQAKLSKFRNIPEIWNPGCLTHAWSGIDTVQQSSRILQTTARHIISHYCDFKPGEGVAVVKHTILTMLQACVSDGLAGHGRHEEKGKSTCRIAFE